MTNPIPTPIANTQSPTPTRIARTARMPSSPPAPAPPPANSVPPSTPSRHGLTAASPVLPTEDPAAYQHHCRQFLDEYQPATPTETQLTQELADTAWRLNRIPLLEADLLSQDPNPQTLIPQLATLGLHSQRLSRQFQKTLDQLREIQAERRLQQERDLKRAAALLELHKHKGLPYDPAQDGFVFSKDEIEAFAQRLMRLNQSRHIEHVLFHMQPPIQREAARASSASYQPQP